VTGQFLSIDPDVATTDQPYVFTNDDSLNATDPLGEDDAGWQYVQNCDASPACADAPFTWQEGLAIVLNAADMFGPDEVGVGEIVDAGADDLAANSEAESASESADKKFNEDQQALVQLAKEGARKGVTSEEAATLKEWAKELNMTSRGPEIHPGGDGWASENVHFHLGPINHIPVR
jgi:hypothetical protein